MDSELTRFPSECRRPDLGDRIVRFDELTPAERDELVQHAAGCPVCEPRLVVVERTHRWLVAQGQPLGPCPQADELFDFGQGPGAAALSTERRSAIEEHVDRCPECKGFVATLATKPPVPLELGELEAEASENGARVVADPPSVTGPSPTEPTSPAVSAQPFQPRRAAWAAAAAVIVAVGLWVGLAPEGPLAGEALGYPALEPFRSATTSQLAFPRGRVAFDADREAPLFELAFELMPHAEADGYRIEVHRHGGGAFDAGELVGEIVSSKPLASAATLGALSAGHYTWSAWARVSELELPLGERDFELAADAELATHWRETNGIDEPQRSFQRLHWLVEHDFATDARQLVRGLPASPERDEFLARQAER